MSQSETDAARRSLWLIFFGGLICLVDFYLPFDRPTDPGFRFDILNDLIGAGLVAWGVCSLAGIRVHEAYTLVMRTVQVVAFLFVLDAVRGHFYFASPGWFEVVHRVFGIVVAASMASFCVAMGWLSEERRLAAATASWRNTAFLFLVIYLIPRVVICLAVWYGLLAGEPLRREPSGWFSLPLLCALLATPWIHMLVSTLRMTPAAKPLGKGS